MSRPGLLTRPLYGLLTPGLGVEGFPVSRVSVRSDVKKAPASYLWGDDPPSSRHLAVFSLRPRLPKGGKLHVVGQEARTNGHQSLLLQGKMVPEKHGKLAKGAVGVSEVS